MNREQINQKLDELTSEVQRLITIVNELDDNITEEVDGCSERIYKVSSNFWSLEANAGYTNDVSDLATVNDTENGYIFHFPSYCSTQQDNFICIDYSEADYIRKLLNHIHNENKRNN
jgi:phage FluMu gp28-like protein